MPIKIIVPDKTITSQKGKLLEIKIPFKSEDFYANPDLPNIKSFQILKLPEISYLVYIKKHLNKESILVELVKETELNLIGLKVNLEEVNPQNNQDLLSIQTRVPNQDVKNQVVNKNPILKSYYLIKKSHTNTNLPVIDLLFPLGFYFSLGLQLDDLDEEWKWFSIVAKHILTKDFKKIHYLNLDCSNPQNIKNFEQINNKDYSIYSFDKVPNQLELICLLDTLSIEIKKQKPVRSRSLFCITGLGRILDQKNDVYINDLQIKLDHFIEYCLTNNTCVILTYPKYLNKLKSLTNQLNLEEFENITDSFKLFESYSLYPDLDNSLSKKQLQLRKRIFKYYQMYLDILESSNLEKSDESIRLSKLMQDLNFYFKNTMQDLQKNESSFFLSKTIEDVGNLLDQSNFTN
jgi:hypothetical protein